MASRMCWGRLNFLPCLENMAFLSGFQNPRMPSYFSNSHLCLSEVRADSFCTANEVPVGRIDIGICHETRLGGLPYVLNEERILLEKVWRHLLGDRRYRDSKVRQEFWSMLPDRS